MAFEEELAHADAWEDTRNAKRKMALANIFLGYHQQNSKRRKRAQDAWRRSALAGDVCKAARVVDFCLAPALWPQDDPSPPPPPLLELR